MMIYLVVAGERGEGLTPISAHSTLEKAQAARAQGKSAGWKRIPDSKMFGRWESSGCDVVAIMGLEVDENEFRVGDLVHVTEGEGAEVMNAKQALVESTKRRGIIFDKGVREGMRQFGVALGNAVQDGLQKTIIVLPTGGPIETAIRDEVKSLIQREGYTVCNADDEGRVEVSWQVLR